MAERIDTAAGRAELYPRREPYWHKLERDQHLGFRKLEDGGTWIARYRDASGKRHYKALGELTKTFGFDDASRAARQWFDGMNQGVRGDKTVADAISLYIDNLRHEKGDKAADPQKQRLQRLVTGNDKHEAHKIAAIPLDKLTAAHVEGWRNELVPVELDAEQKRKAKVTASRDLSRLRAALNYAYRKQMVMTDAAWRGVNAYKGVEKRRDIVLDKAQRLALLEAAPAPLRNYIEAAMLTGCRMGELTSLRVSAFDAKQKMLTVTGKTGKRTFPVSPKAAELFTRLSKDKLPGAYLLTRADGKPWAHSDWDEEFKAAAKVAQMPPGTVMYSLRHTFITEALSAGMGTLEVARITGTSLRMIDKHYGHLASAMTAERLAKVDML